MLRRVATKVASVGRFASMVFGLALVLPLVFGVTSVALGANGQPFILGRATNAATALTNYGNQRVSHAGAEHQPGHATTLLWP